MSLNTSNSSGGGGAAGAHMGAYASHLGRGGDLKKKFTKTFDLSQIAEDPMDSYLDTLGLWKKRIARDGSCLFRAVAEQIYPCQSYHEKVRQECLRYMSDHKDQFSKYVSTISFDEYLEAMKNPLENGGQIEIAAMSKLYRRDFILFQHPDNPGIDVTQNNFEKKIYLCYSYNNHFDAIFTKTHRDKLALIQSLVYEILYDRVFGSGEQVSLARKLLRKSDTIYPKEYMKIRELDDYDTDLEDSDILNGEIGSGSKSGETEESETEETETHKSESTETAEEDDGYQVDENKNLIGSKPKSSDERDLNNNKKQPLSINDKLNIIQKMPLPYKVAKSLDPFIYRNTSFDAWLATKKELEQAANQSAISSLQAGDKCMVKLVNNYLEKWTIAYVQNILSDSANVFVPELNESHCIPFENLKTYNNANELLLIHYTGTLTTQQYQGSSLSTSNNSSDNKRRNTKKKLTIRKSSSFQSFCNNLPALIEVEEQNEDMFLYGNPYYSLHHHPGHHHHHHPNPGAMFQAQSQFHQHQSTSFGHSSGPQSGGIPHSHTIGSLSSIGKSSGAKLVNPPNKAKNVSVGGAGSQRPKHPGTNKMGPGFSSAPAQPHGQPHQHLPPPLVAQPPGPPLLGPSLVPNHHLHPHQGATGIPPFISPPPLLPGLLGPPQLHQPGPSLPGHSHHHQPPQMHPHHHPHHHQHHPHGRNNPVNSNSGSNQNPSGGQTGNNLFGSNSLPPPPFMFAPSGALLPPLVSAPPHPPQPLVQHHEALYFGANSNSAAFKPGDQQKKQPYQQHVSQPPHHHGSKNNDQQPASNDMIVNNPSTPSNPQKPAGNPTTNTSNYLLMPAPPQQQQPAHHHPNQPSSQNPLITRSQSYQGMLSTGGQQQQSQSYENQPSNTSVYDNVYGQGASNLPTSGIDSTSNNIPYSNSFTSGYEMHYNNLSNGNGGLVDESSLLLNQGANIWNKGNKLTRSTSLFTDMAYGGDNSQIQMPPVPQLPPPPPPSNLLNPNPQIGYATNYFVVNIDGPINFNATHSLQDDGSDLPFSDINTMRFFYNLGIEYYRLNIAAPSVYGNHQQGPSFTTTCYGPPPPPQNPQPIPNGPLINNLIQSANTSSTSNNSSLLTGAQTSPDIRALSEPKEALQQPQVSRQPSYSSAATSRRTN